MQARHTAELTNFDEKLNRKENEIFRKYHEERLQRKRYEIEEGVYFPDDELLDEMDEINEEELEAQADLREYADAIKKR